MAHPAGLGTVRAERKARAGSAKRLRQQFTGPHPPAISTVTVVLERHNLVRHRRRRRGRATGTALSRPNAIQCALVCRLQNPFHDQTIMDSRQPVSNCSTKGARQTCELVEIVQTAISLTVAVDVRTTAEREDLARLRKENRTLREERGSEKRRPPCSRTSDGEVSPHRGGEGASFAHAVVPGSARDAQWVLCLA